MDNLYNFSQFPSLHLPWSLFGFGGLGLVAAVAADDEFWWCPHQQCSTTHQIPPEIVDSCRHIENDYGI
jgi:hypothetical protein